MEGLDGERPLQTGEVVIIVVVLLMWAGECVAGQGASNGGNGPQRGWEMENVAGRKGGEGNGGGRCLVETEEQKFEERRLWGAQREGLRGWCLWYTGTRHLRIFFSDSL